MGRREVGWRAMAGVAALAAVVAAGVSVATTLLVVGRDPARSAAPVGRAGDFAALFQAGSSGVLRIQTTACGQGGVGSGFLVGPDLVVTVAHVVDGAHSIVLTAGSSSSPGVVVGVDRAHEVALVRASRPFVGHVFSFATAPPAVGSDVATLGFPLGGDLALSRGSVAGLDRSLDVAAATRLTGLIQVSGPINRGNSGGPLLAPDGSVVGLVEARAEQAEGIGYAVPAATAAPLVAGWQRAPRPADRERDCSNPVGPSTGGDVVVSDRSGAADGPAVVALLRQQAAAINSGDYLQAWTLHTARARRGSYALFAAAERSSLIFDLVVYRITTLPTGDLQAELSFTTVQDAALGPAGQTCSQWHVIYLLQDEGSGLRIDRNVPPIRPPQRC